MLAKRELDLLDRLLDDLKRAGADQADAYYEWGRETEITARDGAVERLKQAVSKGVGVRVFKDRRLGFGYTSDLTPEGLQRLGEQALALARATAADPHNGLPDRGWLGTPGQPADVFDPRVEALASDELAKSAIALERATLAADKRIKTVEEAGAGSYVERVALATSDGFRGSYEKTYAWLYSAAVAEEKGEKQSAGWVDQATHLGELSAPEAVGREAARRAARALGGRKIPSGEMPVILEPPMTKSFIRGLLGALNGDMIYKKSSFLLELLGQPIAATAFTLIDDAGLDRRSGSRPFDGEGLATRRQALIEKGVLQRYLYDVYTARKAGAKPTATASRSYGSLPGIGSNNLYLAPGDKPPAELLRGVKQGLLVTHMMGFGVNAVNGDYSRGAQGFYVDNGEIAYPVQEITVAGNMRDMLKDIDAVGADLDWRGSVGAPSIRFARLTVGGK